jgi:Cd2+/Zn2+-exporting ATPase/Cu+-exporting ATPase
MEASVTGNATGDRAHAGTSNSFWERSTVSGAFSACVLLGDDWLRFVDTLKVAHRCRRIIWQNFAGTLVVDGVGVGLAAFGMLNPLFAAFIHVSSELAFV